MMNKILFYSLLLSTILSFSEGNRDNNYNIGKCGTITPSNAWENLFQNQIQRFKQNNQNARTNNNIVIPVIVHVIYNTASDLSQNIPKEQIDSQIAILNRNFAGQSYYIANVPLPFKSLVANTGISFCPAKIALDGTILSEPGVNRISRTSIGATSLGSLGWLDTYIDENIKPKTIWDPTYYLNIWVVPKARSSNLELLGYATFPTMTGLDGIGDGTGTNSTDGIVCVAYAFGKSLNNLPEYNDGGTATHEIGHWLGLRHIWGDANCGNDFCDDTPKHLENNSGCPIYPRITSCGNGPYGEMFMNYMDYVDDYCSNMFTNGQKERMLVAMNTGNLRRPLLNSPVCDTILPTPIANFIDTQVTTNRCVNSATFNFTDKSLWSYNASSSWSWTFEDGSPATSNVRNPRNIIFNSPGAKNITLTINTPKGSSTITKTINVVFTNNQNLPIIEDFEGLVFPPSGWTFIKRSTDITHNWEEREGYSSFGIGNKCMIFNNTEYAANNKKDDILSPKLDFTGQTNLQFTFDVAYTPFYGDEGNGIETLNDTIEVLLTDNCGNTFTSIYKKGGSDLATLLPGLADEFYPEPNQWRKESVIIPSTFLKPNVQFVFRNYGLWGHTVYIDNINLFLPAQTPIPNFTMSKNEICVGESIILTNTTSSTADSVRWRINGATPSTSASNTTVNATFNTNGNYNITLFIFKGTFLDSITKSITVTTKPTIVINNGGTVLTCPGESISLNASGGGVTLFSWSTGATGNTINVAPTINTTYKVVGVLNGCTSDSASYTLNMKTKPTVTLNSTNIQICPGESATFNASGATTYGWSNGQSGNTITVSPSVNTNYKVAGTTDFCNSDSVQVSVTIKTKPTITVTPQNTTICAGQSVSLTASGASTYGWSNTQTGTSISVSPVQTTTYKVSGTSNGCNSDSVTAIVNITNTNPIVSISKSPNVNVICEGDSITLTASGANIYTWTAGQNIASIKVAPAVQTSYGVVGSLTGCPTFKDSIGTTINVNPRPSMGMITSGGWDTIFVNPATGTSYLWYLNTNTSPIATTTVPYYFATQNGNYTVQIVDANNCKSIKTNPPFSVTLTGIRNNATEIGLKIFPNPNHGIFTIELNSQKYTEYNMNVYNVTGRQIYMENFVVNKGYNTKTISIPNIEKGIYFLNLKNEDGISTYQLLIQ
jgi:hypothetical protein